MSSLVPIFVGHRMEAELVRSLLEANDIPARVFGSGGFAYGAEDAGPNERVMVRSDHVEIALAAIREANLDEEGLIEPTDEDEDLFAEETEYGFQEEDDMSYESQDPTDVDVLAQGSDWGLRVVGLVGLVALLVAIAVLVSQAR